MRAHAALVREVGGDYTLEDVEIGDPRPDEALIRLTAVGHCHTDLIARLGFAGAPVPIVLGHEGAGVVEAVGAEAAAVVAPGDHVVLSFSSCRQCRQCLSGHPAACTSFLARNISGFRLDLTTPIRDAHGQPVAGRWFGQSSFASYCIADVSGLVKVRPDLPLEQLAPLGCGVQTGAGAVFNVLRPDPGGSIAVFGVGAVGLSAVLAAVVLGCETIIAVDRDPRRLQLAARFGATEVVAGGDGLAERVRDKAGAGVDCALDTTAASEVVEAALAALRGRGCLGLVGVGAPTFAGSALGGSKTVASITEGDAVPQLLIPRLIALWESGRFPFDELVTRYGLADIADAERAAMAGEVVKPVLVPTP